MTAEFGKGGKKGRQFWPGWTERRGAMRILLIEDDTMIGTGLRNALCREGMDVDWILNGHDGVEALRRTEYALCLVDLGLPGLSGTEILRLVRREGNKTPAIVITARDPLNERVAALDLGADDYLVKPFEVRELLVRMRAVIRRHVSAPYAASSD